MKKNKIPKTVLGLIKAINNSSNVITISKLENYLASCFAWPLLFLGGFLNYYLFYILLHLQLETIIGDSIFLLTLSLIFILIPYIKLKVTVITHLVSILYSIILIYLNVRFYNFMGPSIWTIAFIEITLSMARITKVMLTYIGITTVLTGVYVVLVLSRTPYEMGALYYIFQTSFFLVLFIATLLVHKINRSRYKKINEQFITQIKHREELEGMYEEAAATEEELREQYNKLSIYNLQIKQKEEVLNHLAYFDTLTDLPNRKMIMERINLLIDNSIKEPRSFYITFIDLDNFKKINDTMGHHVGDEFIKLAATRLKNSIHQDDIIGRIGGDEFALIIQQDLDKKIAYQYIEKIRENFLNPFNLDNIEIRSSASMGISVFPQDGKEEVELMKNADTAMYAAKGHGKNNIQFFQNSMKDELLEKISFENKLIPAIYNEEFFLVFQPIYFVGNGKLRGFEALIRWNSSDLGIVSPHKYIHIAEENGLIIPLGEWILRKACYTFKELQDKFNVDAVLSINISVVQLEHSHFVETIKSVLKDTGLAPEFLEIEITESIFIDSFHDTTLILEELKKINVSISLDDFGTGYSSLSYLRLLPIDVLKIDKSFVDDLSIDTTHKQIIGDIIGLAHNLGISVVAEGIEKEFQLAYLKALGCDYVQGFLLSNPMDKKALEKFLELPSSNCQRLGVE